MIVKNIPKTVDILSDGLILSSRYTDAVQPKTSLRQFSEPAQNILLDHSTLLNNQGAVAQDSSKVIALQLLDLLSSKQGYIRRKGPSFRTTDFYRKLLPHFTSIVAEQKPFTLSAICLSPNFPNQDLCGKSPYPHMASYIALENLHKIADAFRAIYPPGVEFVLGFEGYLVKSVYFHSDRVLYNTKKIFEHLNSIVHSHLRRNSKKDNPVKIVDACWMVEQAFGSMQQFEQLVSKRTKEIAPSQVRAWQQWYETVVPTTFFPSEAERTQFIIDKSYWRAALRSYHYSGGHYGKGLVGFSHDAIPFSPAGRHANMLALQLVPENSYLPHQRAITFKPRGRHWRMKSYDEITSGETHYVPRFVRDYTYPFYYERVEVAG